MNKRFFFMSSCIPAGVVTQLFPQRGDVHIHRAVKDLVLPVADFLQQKKKALGVHDITAAPPSRQVGGLSDICVE